MSATPSQPSQVCVCDPFAERCTPIAPTVSRRITSPCQASATGQGTSSTFKRLPIQKPAKPRPPAAAATPIRRSDLTEIPSFALPRPSQPRVFGSAPSGSWSSRVVRVDEETKVTLASPPPDPRRGSRSDSKPRGGADDLQQNPRRSHCRRAEDRVPTEADLGAHVRRSWRDRSKSRHPCDCYHFGAEDGIRTRDLDLGRVP